MKIIKNETVEEMLESAEEIKFVDGWAYLGSRLTKTVPETMICFYPQDENNNLLVNGSDGLFAMKYLTVYVPSEFVTKHEEALQTGIKATLFALLEEDVEFFDVIPTNLFKERKFLKSFIIEAQKIMRNNIKEVLEAKEKTSFIKDAIREKRRAISAYKKEVRQKKREEKENNRAELNKLRQIEALINSLNSEVRRIDEEEAAEQQAKEAERQARINKEINKMQAKKTEAVRNRKAKNKKKSKTQTKTQTATKTTISQTKSKTPQKNK